MELYNCYTAEEKALREIELDGLPSEEILELAKEIKKKYDEQVLGDETVVIQALMEIIKEQGQRIRY